MRTPGRVKLLFLYLLVVINIAIIVIYTKKATSPRKHAKTLASVLRCLEHSSNNTDTISPHSSNNTDTISLRCLENTDINKLHDKFESRSSSLETVATNRQTRYENTPNLKPSESSHNVSRGEPFGSPLLTSRLYSTISEDQLGLGRKANLFVLEEQLHTWSDDITITETKYVASENNRVFIFGAVTRNSTPSASWDMYAVYGQWYNQDDLKVGSLRCCYKSADGKITENRIGGINIRDKRRLSPASLPLWHVTCAKPTFEPRWISASRYTPCTSENVTYIEPYYAMKKPEGHLVITVKLVYGRINPETIVTFMEAVRYMGVDTVVAYVFHDLNPTAKRVLKFYAYIGLVEYHTITLAELDSVPRRFPPMGDKQYTSDEWLVQRDVIERNAGSTYIGIFDMDEFLIPSNNRSWKGLMADLRTANQNVSHVFFPNVHYLTDVVDDGKNCTTSRCTVFERHIMTSPEKFNFKHQKMIMITSRIDPTTVNNHMAESIPGSSVVNCSPSEAYVRHYGKCGRKFGPDICGNRTTWVRDTSVVEWADRTVHESIRTILKVLVGQ